MRLVPVEVTSRPAHVFPFSAIVGQETLKTALILNAVDPRVGGVLVRGEKGTAKSTAVRALAAVLPDIDVVDGCLYGCDPGDPGSWCGECRERREGGPLPKRTRSARIVDLPVSATEDRLVGTLDFEAALKRGEREFHPGLLAHAHRGVLYVDEVNLLDDHLVDTLLDAAAMGVNTVEREGVSLVHPARFILVGTMNPEEGDIRPQLLDRFGLCLHVGAVMDPESRVEIVRRRHAFEEDPEEFIARWKQGDDELRSRIRRARLSLPRVTLAEEMLYVIADLAIRAGVDGHRADSVMARAATALAALDGRDAVGLSDIEKVAPLVLSHRLRRTPFEDVRADTESLRSALVQALGKESDEEEGGASQGGAPGAGQASIFEAFSSANADEAQVSVSASMSTPLDRARRSLSGRRQESVTDDGRGRYIRSEIPAGDKVAAADIAFDSTIRVAAQEPATAPSASGLAVDVKSRHVRKKVRTRKVGASIVFCVDASGSMGATKRIAAAKAAVLDLLVDAYQRRDRVSLVTFRGESADLALAPTASVELANVRLRDLPTGGATPLAHGILKSLEVLNSETRRQPDTIPWLVLITDGRGNVGMDGGLGSEDAKVAAVRVADSHVNAVVIDTSSASSGGSAAKEIARLAGAEYVRLASVDEGSLTQTVRHLI